MDSDSDMIEMIEDLLREEGIATCRADITDLKHGRLDIIDYIQKNRPDVVLFDVPPPYQENWNFFKLVQKAFPGIDFVVTTTNKKALESRTGEVPNAIEILSKPFNYDEIVNAVLTRHKDI